MFTKLLLVILHSISCIFATSIKHYKISMVSADDANKPALFTHGESPVWDVDTQSLFFVDALQQNVHRLDYATGKIHTKHIGKALSIVQGVQWTRALAAKSIVLDHHGYGQVNVVSLVSGSRRLLVAVRAALYLLDWEMAGDAALRLITSVDNGLPDNVINEGKSDMEGRFWAGTKGPQSGDDVLPDKASLYSIEQGSFQYPRVQIRPVSISNGLVWSLNNSVLYYIDSPTQKIEAFDFDSYNGAISGRRTIIDVASYGYEDAIPDGMTIDSQGNLWVALMFGGSVLHIDPDRRLVVYGYKLPVSRTTSLCWGGPNLDELFVTTSKEISNSDEPLSGAIFTIRDTGSKGVLAHTFKMDNANEY